MSRYNHLFITSAGTQSGGTSRQPPLHEHIGIAREVGTIRQSFQAGDETHLMSLISNRPQARTRIDLMAILAGSDEPVGAPIDAMEPAAPAASALASYAFDVLFDRAPSPIAPLDAAMRLFNVGDDDTEFQGFPPEAFLDDDEVPF